MDLWDVVKLLVRRWVVSVPLLLLTALALFWTASSVTPKYTAQGNILMLPPTTEINSTDEAERAVNPWETDSLTGAVITLLRNRSIQEQLASEGYTGTWEAGRDIQFFSVINIEVTADTTGQAQATTQRLSEVVTHEVNARQQGYGLTEGQMVGTVTLGAGENVEIARGNQMRALIVVLFAGLMLTVGLTIGTDALLRARSARHARGQPVSARAATEPVPALAVAGARFANGVRREPVRQNASVDGPNHAQQSRQPGINVSYRTPSATTRPADEAGQRSAPAECIVDDSTVVLPLSNIAPAADHSKEDSGRDGATEARWR